MRLLLTAVSSAVLTCVAAKANGEAQPKIFVQEPKSKISVGLKEDNRTLIAKDAQGKKLWEVDVIAQAGVPAVGQQVVRSLSIEKGNVRAVYGKHSFADFDLKSGKLVGRGSD